MKPTPVLKAESERSTGAMVKIASSGLPLPSAPQDEIPHIPSDITGVDDEALMGLFSELTSWSDYLSAQVALAQIDERDAQRKVDLAEANATTGNWTGGTGDRVAVMKAKIAADPGVREAFGLLDERHAYRKLIEVLAANLERDTVLVSRELTRRTATSTGLTKRRDRWTT